MKQFTYTMAFLGMFYTSVTQAAAAGGGGSSDEARLEDVSAGNQKGLVATVTGNAKLRLAVLLSSEGEETEGGSSKKAAQGAGEADPAASDAEYKKYAETVTAAVTTTNNLLDQTNPLAQLFANASATGGDARNLFRDNPYAPRFLTSEDGLPLIPTKAIQLLLNSENGMKIFRSKNGEQFLSILGLRLVEESKAVEDPDLAAAIAASLEQ